MPKIQYIRKRFSETSKAIIDVANKIIAEYAAQGFDLTLRQLYYQFVSRDLIANKQTEYKRLGAIINDGRMAGLIDWNSIVDRTRNVRRLDNWTDPADIIKDAARWYHVDMWKNQEYRPEVWIEKDALVGVIEGTCQEYDVPFFSCRGYTSQSEMWRAGQRLERYTANGQTPVIIHLGDHDPSGIDMTRDIFDRLAVFMGGVEVKRIALNMDQVEQYGPPPNPAKLTDTRARDYIQNFGLESWELDALDPTTLRNLIQETITKLIDQGEWDESEEREAEGTALLDKVCDNWGDVVDAID